MESITKIKFTDIPAVPQAVKDFLRGEIPGFEEDIFSIENFRQKISSKKQNFSFQKRQKLSEVLSKQMAAFSPSKAQLENLKLLHLEETFSVTTGHQLNLFSGPVFFIYKILQTIKTASLLKSHFPENNFVPVFWMATEDHDFDEINHFKTENNLYQINEKSGGAVGRIKVTDNGFIQDFKGEFKDSAFGAELIVWMEDAYKAGNTLAKAVRILVQDVFAEYGLIVIDGDDKDLKTMIQEVFKDELLYESLHKKTREKVKFLADTYGKVQVNPREINLFYLSETRNRIEKKGDKFQITDTALIFSEEEMLQILQENPEKLSPNALMRPVYQETVLPNIAYIGGNAEILYWMEIKDYFASLSLTFPILIPRNSMLFLKEKTLNKIGKLGLSVQDFFENFEKLKEKKLLANTDISTVLDKNEKLLKSHFQELKGAAENTDFTFGNLVKAEEARQLKSFQRMRRRLLRAEKRKQTEFIDRMNRVYAEIHPSGNWQERILNFSVFYADHGRNWLETCLREMDVNESALHVTLI